MVLVVSQRGSHSGDTVKLILPPGLNMSLWPQLVSGVLSGTPSKWDYEAINKERKDRNRYSCLDGCQTLMVKKDLQHEISFPFALCSGGKSYKGCMEMNLDPLTLSSGALYIIHEGNLIRNETEGEWKCIPANGPDSENSPEALCS